MKMYIGRRSKMGLQDWLELGWSQEEAGRSPRGGDESMSTITPAAKRRTTAIGDYTDRGGATHYVLMVHAGRREWEIIDTDGVQESVLIERLAGEGESTQTASALARDYLAVSLARQHAA